MLSKNFLAVATTYLILLPLSDHAMPNGTGGFHRSSENKASPTVSPDLEIIRMRIIQDLLTPSLDEPRIQSLMDAIKQDGSWPDIDYADVSRTGFEHSRHLDAMFELSRAYRKPDSRWYQHPEVRSAALASLDFWLENDFICDNWWWNEMGTPGRMINTLLVLDTDLNEHQARVGLRIAGRANLEASGARPGGDLIQIAGMLGKQALFRRDETVLERVVNVMAEQINVTTGRGLKPDMSFHHRVDNVISTLSYGLGYASSFSYWAVKIGGTRYKFPAHATRLLIDYFLDGICKSMVHATYPDPGAKNRDLSRKGTLSPTGEEIAENLMKISDYRNAELQEILRIRKGQASPELTWNRFFWHSEYFTHQRPGYFASVRMHSSRNHTMEQPHNEEGLKMHHVGDGSNFISRTGKEYFDIFPVWDWQKIPGATILQKPELPHWKQIAKKGLTDFVGGVSDGRYGAAAMDFKSAHDPVSAQKAWFFFDDEYVCLGSGITAEAKNPVFTTLNQTLLNSPVVVKTKDEERTLAKGKHAVSQVSWVLHDEVGYVFTKPQPVGISNTVATGRWRDINHQASASPELVEAEVFTLWLDHGAGPEGAKYEYIVVPASGLPHLNEYVKNAPVKVLNNSSSVQAVFHSKLKIAQVVFYEPGQVEVTNDIFVRVNTPCILMVKTDGKSITGFALSDPTQKLASLEVKTNVVVEGSGAHWRAVWDKKEKTSLIQVDLPKEGHAGQTVVLNWSLRQ